MAGDATGCPPYLVAMGPGQSIGDAVAEMNEPHPGWFLTVQFPGTIVAPAGPLGSGELGGPARARPGRLRPR